MLTAVHPEGQSDLAVMIASGQEDSTTAVVSATATGVGDI